MDVRLQSSVVSNLSQELILNRVLRYKNTNSDLSKFFEYLVIDLEGKLTTRANVNTRKNRRLAQEILTEQDILRIDYEYIVKFQKNNYIIWF